MQSGGLLWMLAPPLSNFKMEDIPFCASSGAASSFLISLLLRLQNRALLLEPSWECCSDHRNYEPCNSGSILRRWKRNWFALWLDGTLGYYHDETAQDEEDRVLIHFNVRDIKVGQECHDVQPPEGRSRDGLLTVNLREGSRLHLCAETRDDAIAWKTALLEANSTPVRIYSPYQDYYEVVPPNAHEATYVRSYYGPSYAGPGVTHVIVREDPCYNAGAPLAMGMLAGAATGGKKSLHLFLVPDSSTTLSQLPIEKLKSLAPVGRAKLQQRVGKAVEEKKMMTAGWQVEHRA
ncbi:Pleckstrin homology domain-containing family B member 1 [Microtus ochrogaster]|uniref:Pleckstrin homology domain-containing family B member 1 n=1 Tax=Microtus ochrogaster TaxID=79684 RepID=A0A8J6KY11_MICOH|nr:Pleckstrin homology domain-containing family B member 1 [Microtus ochrogaster]